MERAEWLSLILEKSSNSLDSVATLEFDGERMVCQRDARLFLIRLQGRLEKGLKASRFGLVSHITDLRGGRISCEEVMAREWYVREGYGDGRLHRLIDPT